MVQKPKKPITVFSQENTGNEYSFVAGSGNFIPSLLQDLASEGLDEYLAPLNAALMSLPARIDGDVSVPVDPNTQCANVQGGRPQDDLGMVEKLGGCRGEDAPIQPSSDASFTDDADREVGGFVLVEEVCEPLGSGPAEQEAVKPVTCEVAGIKPPVAFEHAVVETPPTDLENGVDMRAEPVTTIRELSLDDIMLVLSEDSVSHRVVKPPSLSSRGASSALDSVSHHDMDLAEIEI